MKRTLNLFIRGLVIVGMVLGAWTAWASNLVLEDGRTINVGRYWKDGDFIKYSKHGSVVGLSLEKVVRIEGSTSAMDGGVIDFGFDVWKFGTPIKELIDAAEKYDIPLHVSGMDYNTPYFNAKASRPYAETHAQFAYQQVLLGYPVRVLLTLAEESRRLALIEIEFFTDPQAPDKLPHDDVLAMMQEKYGEPFGVPRLNFNQDAVEWHMSGDNRIDLVNLETSVKLTYLNLPWYQRMQKEKKTPDGEQQGADFKKDAGKF